MFFKSKEMPLVSVVIPSYNHEKFIEAAVNSVLKQDYKNIELIVIDDGSRDNTLELLNKIKDERLTVISQENRGAHNTINRGLEMAKGEYLAILNSDDIFSKDRIKKCVDYLQEHSNVQLVCSYIDLIDSEDKPLGTKKGWHNLEPWPIENKSLSYAATDDFTKNLIMSNFISTTSNMVFTKKLYKQIGGMRNLRFAHDWDFALRAVEYGECAIIEKPLMKYRLHNTNTINTNRKHMLFEICWVFAANIQRIEKRIFSQPESILEIQSLMESTNFQGNDKVVWLLKMYFDAYKNQGIVNPEEVFLENQELRESMFKYIAE